MYSYLKRILCVFLATLLVLSVMARLSDALAQPYAESPDSAGGATVSSASTANLLVNGDMDQLGFYWRPTNHFVATPWFEWWADHTAIPEYINGGHPHHNECYPPPPSGMCHDSGTGVYNNSQGYIRWGAPFDAGMYQPVAGTVPCTLYTFEMYNRNDGDDYHPQIGIDPTGWIITRLGSSLPNNCPPDGLSPCPNPHIESLPSTIVWSEEATHPRFTWGPLQLTVEALKDTISVWTRTRPESAGPLSSYWDYGSLTYTPFPGNLLPEPDSLNPSGYISNIAHTFNGQDLILTWTTSTPASTQVLYTVDTSTTVTVPLTYTLYLPFIHQADYQPDFDPTPVQQHSYVIRGLSEGDVVKFLALSRHATSDRCVTETSAALQVTVGSDELVVLDSAEARAIWDSYGSP
jgi:hypothetical protein